MPRRSHPHRLLRHLPTAAAAVLVTALLSPPATAAAAPAAAPDPSARQDAFGRAARESRVPQGVLMAVSYLESRWDSHGGQPSTSAGFGPMHLTDAALVRAATPHHHSEGAEDPRGDGARPMAPPNVPVSSAAPATRAPALEEAARLTGLSAQRLRSDAAANIRGGAALLARYQRDLGQPSSADPAKWYGAVARYSGASDAGGARWFADQVYDLLRSGAAHTTSDGQRVELAASPTVRPDRSALSTLRLRESSAGQTECPRTLGCEWIPAPYQLNDPNDQTKYGNHDKSDRPRTNKITHIVVHDTETSYDNTIKLVQNPRYVSWQYTLRSNDGHVAQHVKHKDVAWQAGNWYINTKSIGLEHEGFLAQGATWYTEALYRSSARLVRYLTSKYGIPRDRAHILGHDSVPGRVPETVRQMHEDPGPFWDWDHYFKLIGAPLHQDASPFSKMVMIKPDFDRNKVPYTGCDSSEPAKLCPEQGSASIMLRTEPRADAPLVRDIGKRPPDGIATISVYDHSARASTGAKYAVADREGDWTAVWYLGQKAWFHNPKGNRTAVPVRGKIVTPKPGAASVPVYGWPYPEKEAYPAEVPFQEPVPMQYEFKAGQRYAIGLTAPSEYYHAKVFDATSHRFVRGTQRYYQLQFGHRNYYVITTDVVVKPA